MDTGTRKLIYVPIIHMSADLGTLASEVKKRGVARIGEEAWSKHTETVSGFWRVLTEYLSSMRAEGLKIYQDGMVADGELGMKIVSEGVAKGSENYKIVSSLLEKGAVLVKTEDFNLLRQEHERLVEISKAAGLVNKVSSYLRYRLIKNRLLKKRDEYMAGRVNETLKDGETGLLFIGAYHDVLPFLSRDIKIIEIKDRKKVRDYQRKFFLPRYGDEAGDLSAYLVSPVEVKSDKEG